MKTRTRTIAKLAFKFPQPKLQTTLARHSIGRDLRNNSRQKNTENKLSGFIERRVNFTHDINKINLFSSGIIQNKKIQRLCSECQTNDKKRLFKKASSRAVQVSLKQSDKPIQRKKEQCFKPNYWKITKDLLSIVASAIPLIIQLITLLFGVSVFASPAAAFLAIIGFLIAVYQCYLKLKNTDFSKVKKRFKKLSKTKILKYILLHPCTPIISTILGLLGGGIIGIIFKIIGIISAGYQLYVAIQKLIKIFSKLKNNKNYIRNCDPK